MPKKRASSRATSYFFLLVNALCWGASLIIVKPALEITSPFLFLVYRYALAIPLSLPFLWYHRKFFKLKNIKTVFGVELLGTTLALTCLYFGLARTTAIEASLLVTTTPIFVVVAGVIFLKEKLERHEWLGMTLAFFATILLTVLPSLNSSNGLQSFSLSGNILVLGHNIATALYFILAKSRYKKLPKLFASTMGYYLGFISFLLLSLAQGGSVNAVITQIQFDVTQVPVLWAAFYMAVFGSIIGLSAYLKGQDGIEASEASLFWYLEPLVYLPLGIFLLGESIGFQQIIAITFLILGVAYATKRKTKKRPST